MCFEYFASLLHQWRHVERERPQTRRTCTETVVHIGEASSAVQALSRAKDRGRAGEIEGGFHHRESPLDFEFIGVAGLICVSSELQPKVVWFEERLSRLSTHELKTRLPSADTFPAVRWADLGVEDGDRLFAARVRFQSRDPQSNPWGRLLHDRVIHLHAESPATTLEELSRVGPSIEPEWDFIGVLDLLEIDAACEPDEMWYEVRTMVQPMERASQILPTEARLLERARVVLGR